MELPTHIINHIKDILWGNRVEWKAKFSQIINVMIHSVGKENINAKTYCPSCGENERWLFEPICFYCNDTTYKYPYNTFSGTNQGAFYLHNQFTLLYSGINKQTHYPNAARCWGSSQWRTRRSYALT